SQCYHSSYRYNVAFTLWTLFEATVLCLNAICDLNEERFLAKVGWASWQNVQGFGEPPTVKSQILNLIRSIRTVARIPLIFLNIVTIIVNNWCLGERND
ncbi:immediate early response 3-interacting protein 1-like, partial [Bombus affinis]|uniref:immediate early response 3-interacting protein 1-like n=1 Tax=Bombus affinis TaxID=309941 RepID=UPI0021B7801A